MCQMQSILLQVSRQRLAPSTTSFKKMAISLGLRFVINAAGWVLMWALGVNVRGMAIGVAYILTVLVEYSLMTDCVVNEEGSMRAERRNASTEDEGSYLYELPWKPSIILYCQIAIRLAVFCLYIGCMLFAHGDLIPPVHFPARVIWCIIFFADVLLLSNVLRQPTEPRRAGKLHDESREGSCDSLHLVLASGALLLTLHARIVVYQLRNVF